MDNKIDEDSTSITAYNRNNFSIYPNPCNEHFTLQSFEENIVQAELFDVNGRIISSTNLSGAQQQLTFDISDLNPGIYIVRVRGEKHHSVLKIIKK